MAKLPATWLPVVGETAKREVKQQIIWLNQRQLDSPIVTLSMNQWTISALWPEIGFPDIYMNLISMPGNKAKPEVTQMLQGGICW